MPEHTQKTEHSPKEHHAPKKKFNPLIGVLILLIVIAGAFTGFIYWKITQTRVYIENAAINAPIIALSPQTPGVLDKLFVKEGDAVKEGMTVAMVGGNPIKAKTDGIVIAVQNTPGQTVSMQDAIIKMIDPGEFRVIGQLEEDKGLNEIKVGQQVIFTVDAFGSKEYAGEVDMISPTARSSDIVFSISDTREEKKFDVHAKYDVGAYPELKNGMSAKMWVYK